MAPPSLDPRILAAYLALGAAVLANNGAFYPPLILLVAGALALTAAGLVRPKSTVGTRWLVFVLVSCWLLSLLRPPGPPGRWLTVDPKGLALYFACTCAALAIALRALYGDATRRDLALLLFAYAGAGVLQLLFVPAPAIDVHWLQQAGARALFSGTNPYSIDVPNLYGPADTRMFFGDERTLLTHYPYPPLSLLVTAIGWGIAGDVRWTLLAAQLASAWLLWSLALKHGHSRSIALGLTAAWLLHPRGLFVLEQSWTEPLSCAGWFALLRVIDARPRLVAAVASLFFGAKQYSLLLIPFVRKRAILVGLLVSAALILPFALWNPRNFFADVVLFQVRQPFRPDALSVPAFVAWATGWRAPSALSVFAWGTATLVAARTVQLRPQLSRAHALSLCAALSYFAFFVFAKQAFCNYYYFVGALLLGVIATAGQERA